MSLLLPFLLACASGTVGEGTSVGNPGEAAARMAPTDAVALDRAELVVAGIDWLSCDGTTVQGEPVGHLDLLADSDFVVPGGCWSGVALRTGGPLALAGTAADGGAVELLVDVETIELFSVQQFDVTDARFVLELARGGWSPDDPDALSDALAGHSALVEDIDGDGWLDDAERAAGLVMAGPDREEDAHDDDGESHDEDDESESDDDHHDESYGCEDEGEDDVDDERD